MNEPTHSKAKKVSWEFLNSDGFWVECIGGEGHAHEAAAANGPGKYRKVDRTVKYEEYEV